MSEEQQQRQVPASELDFNLMTTDSVWGKSSVPEGLKARLNRYYLKRDSRGKPLFDQKGNLIGDTTSLWSLLGFYTRDLRLGNLGYWNGEIQYAQYFLDLANDLLQAEMTQPFLIALSRVATLLELSQSKNGFLRRRMGTLTTESMSGDMEPPKKSLFGSQKKKDF